MSRTSDTLVVLPTCRGYTIPQQTIEVDWCVVHDRQEWPVEVEDDNDNWRRPTAYRGNNGWTAVGTPEMEHGNAGDGGVAEGSERANEAVDRSDLFRAGSVRHIVAPRPEIYGERTSAIRQSGLDYGLAEGYQFVLTVDDDCVLPRDWAEQHVQALGGMVPVCNNTVPGYTIRGLPVGFDLPVGISHGLWSGVLDWPAWFQLSNNPDPVTIPEYGWRPIRSPFPMCGMNVGFRREVLPAVFFQHTFRRHDDIFAGWVAQAILDLHGYGYVSGGAVVLHQRASDAKANLIKERPGDAVNKALLSHVRGFQGTEADVAGTFDRLAAHVGWLRVGNSESDRLIQEYAASMQTWQRRLR